MDSILRRVSITTVPKDSSVCCFIISPIRTFNVWQSGAVCKIPKQLR